MVGVTLRLHAPARSRRNAIRALGPRPSHANAQEPRSDGRSLSHGDSYLRGSPRRHLRLVPERRRLPPAASRIAAAAGVALPHLRSTDKALRQHPDPLLDVAARSLPPLL